jgi:catalase
VYERMVKRLSDIDLGLAQSVAQMVGGPSPEKAGRANHGKTATNLSQMDFVPASLSVATRKVAIIIADGYDPVALNAVKIVLEAAQAVPLIIGTRRSEIFAADQTQTPGKGIKPDHHLEGLRSTLVDAVFIPGGEKSVVTLGKSGRALHWIREAFGHLKAIGATGEAVKLVNDTLALKQVSISFDHSAVESYGVVTVSQASADSFREAYEAGKNAPSFVGKFIYAISCHRVWGRELDGLNSMVAY